MQGSFRTDIKWETNEILEYNKKSKTMINWFKDIIINLLQATGATELSSQLSIVVNIKVLIGVAGVVVVTCFKFASNCIDILKSQRPIDSLYKSLIGYSIVSKVELIYQIRSYIAPHFKDEKTIKQLLKNIKKSSGDRRLSSAIFSVIGNPACGKTTTMRYLYCQLAKQHKCVYFQMQHVKNMKSLSYYLKKQKSENNLPDHVSVIAFFDGLDEAYEFFQQECPSSMENAFKTIFFQDPEPKIDRIFSENKLNLACVIVSFRPEFLEKSVHSLTALQRGNVYQKIYEIVGMADKDIVKIFKSLKVLKKLDAKLDEDERRHKERFPPGWQEYKYIRLLRKILKDNPNCIFQYPMYIRYAYAFMKEYLKRQSVGNKLTLSTNISISFDILVHAIIKWEFHVYYGKSSKENEEEMEQLTKKMEQCAQDIAIQLQLKKATELPKKQFEQIIQQYFQDEIASLVLAHCFMVSGDRDKVGWFTFCHSTFQEYFLAKYLFEKADYVFRKECFDSDEKSEYLMHMYYSILCQNEQLNERISKSIFFEGMKYITEKDLTLTPESYVLLNEKTTVKLVDNPKISLVEIYEYIPYIFDLFYRGKDYLQEEIETILETGTLNLQDTNWSRLDYAEGVIPPERVEKLDISWLPITDVETLKKYNYLKCLYIRFSEDDNEFLEKIYVLLQNFSLNEIHIYSETGRQCDKIFTLFCNGKLQVQKVFVQAPDYSQVHIKMYELNELSKELGKVIHFYLSVRSNKNSAKQMYMKEISKKNVRMLTAVFALETDNNGILSLNDKSAEATLWNGLSLAECYQKVKRDNNESAYQIYRYLEPFIMKDSSELSHYFGVEYGSILFERHQYKLAKSWLLNSYKYSSNYKCKNCMAKLGLKLYKAWICSKEDGLEKFSTELEDRIKVLSDNQMDWKYSELLKLHCVKELVFWEKGKPEPENIYAVLSRYKEVADYYVDRFNAVYFEMIYANRTEKISLWKQLLENLAQELEKTNEESIEDDQWKYAAWVKCQEQKLYYFILKNNRIKILQIVDELLNFPYFQFDKKVFTTIYSFYQNNDDSTILNVDRHLLWDSLIF